MVIARTIFLILGAFITSRSTIAAENLVLLHQLGVLQRSVKRLRLRKRGRIFWAILCRIRPNWRCALLIVQPDTVVRWHRSGFRLFWRCKSHTGKVGRPKIEAEIRQLIRCLSRKNPTWGVPRIQSELAPLGLTVSETTVRKYRTRHRNPP